MFAFFFPFCLLFVLQGAYLLARCENSRERENIEISYQNKVFITAHRRENIGKPLENIATAIKELAIENPEIEFHWALHPNPNTRKNILSVFDKKPQNIILQSH